MSEPLFREIAIAHQGQRLTGELLLSQPISIRCLALLLAVLTLATLLWLGFNTYQRKVPVAGTVEPESGVVELLAPQLGIIAELAVGLDQKVTKGQKLFVLDSARTLESGQSLEAGSLLAQQQQLAALQQQIQLEQQKLQAVSANFSRRIALASSMAAMWSEARQHQQELLELRQRQSDRGLHLLHQGVLAAADQESLAAQLFLQQQSIAETSIQLQRAHANITDLEIERDAQLLQARQQLTKLQAETELNHRQLLQLQLERRQVVVAPADGMVSSLQLRQGMLVKPQQPALSLLPSASRLQVELKVPSQAMGFLRAGQRIALRLDAFPYQKFGVQHATLASMAHSTEYSSHPGPGGGMPYYRLIADLDKQTILAYGKELPLRPGMQLAADISVDRRSLLEWLLEPLYSIRGH
ncbi:MAG: HlyD family efflux transporter periplasmic adaptor subunit [Gammaproteobacteria bacterium]